MKNIILLFFIFLFFGCNSGYTDPLRFKGGVVVHIVPDDKVYLGKGNVLIKLPSQLRDKYNDDYLWIKVVKIEKDKLSEGDTIK